MRAIYEECRTPLQAQFGRDTVEIVCPSCQSRTSISRDADSPNDSTTNPLAPDKSLNETWPSGDSAGTRTIDEETQTIDQPTRPFGGYELIHEIARGGMGVVYRAMQTKLKRVVALKMIRSNGLATDQQIKRFYVEAAAQLDHPGIVPVHEVGEVAGQHFYSMGFVEGQSLHQRLAQGPLETVEAAQLACKIGEAVDYAHTKGVIHRDLEPGNVLIDRKQQPRVTDFGLAKRLETDSGMTISGQILGTPSYMPPEQALGQTENIGPASDVFALGAMLYAMTTGRPPFRAASITETLRQVVETEPVSPRQLNPSIGQDLETICLKCLQKEPHARYASASDLVADLQRFLNREPIEARPVGRLERSVKWTRRNPRAAALIFTSLLLLLALVAFVVSFAYQTRLESTNNLLTSSQKTVTERNEELRKRNSDLEIARRAAEKAESVANEQRDHAEEARDQLARFRYDVDMQIASLAWQEGDIQRVLTILNRYHDEEQGLRGFEWYYLTELCHHESHRWNGAGIYFDGGDELLMADRYNVKIVDAETMETIREFKETFSAGAIRLALSGDEKRAIGVGHDRKVRVWNVADGNLIALKDEPKYDGPVALNHDGSLALVPTMDDRSVQLWRIDTDEIVFDWKCEAQFAASVVSDTGFSPDGKWFAIGWPVSNSIRFAEVAKPDEFIEVPLLKSTSLNHICTFQFDPTSQFLYASFGQACGTITLDGLSADSEFKPLGNSIYGSILGLRKDGKAIATVNTFSQAAPAWNTKTGRLVGSKKGHTSDAYSASFRGDAYTGLTTSYDGTRTWDWNEEQEYSRLAETPEAPTDLQYSPDGKWLALGFRDSRVTLIQESRRYELPGVASQVWKLEFTDDSSLLAAGMSDGTVRVWNVDDKTLLYRLAPPEWAPDIYANMSVDIDGTGTRLVTSGYMGEFFLWNLENGELIERQKPPDGEFSRAGFRSVINEVVTNEYDRSRPGTPLILSFWGTEPTRKLATQCMDFRFNADGQKFLGRNSQTLVQTDAITGQPLHIFPGHRQHIYDFDVSTDESRAITISGDGLLKVWDLRTGEATISIPAANNGRRCAFHPDGERIAVVFAAGDGVRIFSAPKVSPSDPPR